ncbi:hypothetical protein MMC31_001556 [Peltigera leucophlebia]|nr:hypothetical protein [Peltigera leucophlebia]
MPKTRQQRMAEERSGHAPSPPQILADKPRVPRRTRAKAPSANNTVAAGPVVPVAQSAAPGPEAPHALVHVWADQDRYVYDPSHEFTIPSALVPELVVFIKRLRDHGTQNSATASSSSATQVTPSLGSRQFAHILQSSRTEGPSAPIAPQPASTGVVSHFKETSPIATSASFACLEQPFQQLFGPTPPLDTRANLKSPPQELHHSLTPHHPPPARIEATSQKISHPVQPTRSYQPIHTISQSLKPTLVVQQALSAPGKGDIIEKQALGREAPDRQIKEAAQFNQTRPMPKKVSSSKSQTGASGAARRKRRAKSGKPSAPAPIKRKLTPVPSDPETIHALGLPAIFRKHHKLPAYKANGHAFYGKVAPSDEYLKFHDEAPTNTDSSMENVSMPQAPQASGTSVPGRLIRPIRSVKRRFGFSALTTISESSETTPPKQPAKNQPAIRFPSRWLDRMNATKRKRWTSPTSPESISNPKGKSYGLGEVEFYGNAEEDENEDNIAGQQPGKVRRKSHLQNFSSQGAANSHTSRPCTGQHSISNTPIPITNTAGSFKVPSSGDSDWSDSESEPEASSQAAAAPPSNNTTPNPGPTSRPQFRPNGYENWLKTATPLAAAVVQRMEMSHAAAGQRFEAVMSSTLPPTSRPRFNALGDWLQTAAPSVAAALEQMDVDPDVAGAAFQRGLDNYNSS